MMPVANLTLEKSVQTVRHGVGCITLHQYGVVEVFGPDAASFLHSQTTNDVNRLIPGEGQLTCLVDRKGHLQAFLSLHCIQKDCFWLLLEKVHISALIERLEQYHFTENLSIQDRASDFEVIGVLGPNSRRFLQDNVPEFVNHLAENGVQEIQHLFGSAGQVIRHSFTGEEDYAMVIPKTHPEQLEESLLVAGASWEMAVISQDALNVLRLEAGIPQYGIDIDDTILLPETGLEQVAVSYAKGCYIGQEVIARVKTYGSVQKGLVGLILKAEIPMPPTNTPCFMAGQDVGVLKSAVYSPILQAPIAMAYLNREFRVPQKQLNLTIGERTMPATVVLLPFYRPLSADEQAQEKYNAGLKAFAENQEEEAVSLLREAIDLNPHFADAYESLGVILARHEQYEEAIALMQKLADLEPAEVMAHTNLSVFYMKLGMKEEAEVEKAKATTLSFKKAMAGSQKIESEAEKQRRQQAELESKIQMFQEVLQLDSEDSLASYGLGNIYYQLAHYSEALPLLEKAIRLDPKYTVAYLALGKTLEALQEINQAKQIFEQGIEVAAKRGDLMPLQEMQRHLANL